MTKDIRLDHVALLVRDLDVAVENYRQAVVAESMPWQKSVVVSPKKTHGVLVKVSTEYTVKGGEWAPSKT